MSISEDRLTYTYQIRKNVKFHNSRPLTVDDIIWSYERIMDSETPSPSSRFIRIIQGAKKYEAGNSDNISGLEKVDDYTLKVTFENALDPSYYLFQPGTAILPKEEVESRGKDLR